MILGYDSVTVECHIVSSEHSPNISTQAERRARVLQCACCDLSEGLLAVFYTWIG